MGIFSNTTPFDQVVEKVTHETNTKEDWSLILDICDKVKVGSGSSSQNAKDCLKSIIKRLNHQDPHVAIQAITLLDACVSNCGLSFHLEVASREFETEFRKLLQKTQEKVIRDKLLSCLEKWALNEFAEKPELNLIPSMYNKLKHAGAEFPSSESESPSKGKKSGTSGHGHKSKSHHPGSNNSSSAATSAAQKEAEDLAKAIELSLKESQQSPKSIYPQAALNSSGATIGSSGHSSVVHQEPRKVRALYDFEAAEDNELTFYAGEIVHVLDDSDANWWEGTNQRGTGLFPANFVTADLSAEPPSLDITAKKSVQFSDEVAVKTVEAEPEQVEIDEAKIDKALHFLHEADPTGETPDPPELAILEDQVQQMGPLIDQELEKVDRHHAQLTKLGTELVEALNLYHTLMRDPSIGTQQANVPQYSTMGPSMSTPGSMPLQSGAYPFYPVQPATSVPYGSFPAPGPLPQHSYASPIPSQVGIPSNHVPVPNSMYGHPIPQENGPPPQGISASNPGQGSYHM